MKIPYFTESSYYEVFDSIARNQSNYCRGKDNSWIRSIFKDRKYYKESRIDATLPELVVGRSVDADLSNTIVLYEALKDKLSPRQAANPYLWSYLTHFNYWDYTIDRWFDETVPSVDKIKERMFCGTSSGSRTGFLRNALSRLWWAGYLTHVDGPRPYRYTEILFSNSDLAVSVLERKFSMNREVTLGILSAIDSIDNDPYLDNVGILSRVADQEPKQVYEWRELCKFINRYGAVSLLDALDRQDIKDLSVDYILHLRE